MNFEGHNSAHGNVLVKKSLYTDTHTEMEAGRRKRERKREKQILIFVDSE